MRALQWISDNGYYLFFGENPPFILNSPLFSSVGATAQIFKAPMQDGAKTYNATLEQRTIPAAFTFEAKGNKGLKSSVVMDETRNMLNFAFSPKVSGWLIYNNNRGGNIIRARPVSTPVPLEQGANYIKFEIEFLTDSATWQDATLQSAKLGDLKKLFTFPARFPIRFGRYTQTTVIKNASAEEIKPVIEVYSQLSTLKITNETTGQEIEITNPVAEGQYMRIDSAEKTVSLYENGMFLKDVSNWADGPFITLAPGENVLKSENNIPGDIPAAVIFWRDIVMGV